MRVRLLNDTRLLSEISHRVLIGEGDQPSMATQVDLLWVGLIWGTEVDVYSDTIWVLFDKRHESFSESVILLEVHEINATREYWYYKVMLMALFGRIYRLVSSIFYAYHVA